MTGPRRFFKRRPKGKAPAPIDHSKFCGICGRGEPPLDEIEPTGTRCWDIAGFEGILYRCACGATREVLKVNATPRLISRAHAADRHRSRRR